MILPKVVEKTRKYGCQSCWLPPKIIVNSASASGCHGGAYWGRITYVIPCLWYGDHTTFTPLPYVHGYGELVLRRPLVGEPVNTNILNQRCALSLLCHAGGDCNTQMRWRPGSYIFNFALLGNRGTIILPALSLNSCGASVFNINWFIIGPASSPIIPSQPTGHKLNDFQFVLTVRIDFWGDSVETNGEIIES